MQMGLYDYRHHFIYTRISVCKLLPFLLHFSNRKKLLAKVITSPFTFLEQRKHEIPVTLYYFLQIRLFVTTNIHKFQLLTIKTNQNASFEELIAQKN